ncbi:bifunctional nicotinamidase/pyrazinamidase [Weeksellaceae bacterium KMM 9713]|uniref:Nicotinamidase n=1 Tax=Profundicola chukchiensis TaxID=2961959 RepID=A0A9X4RV16_9FLAO|nr:bifunctional nicotinamidase/pyrazinamidase [Profundicola chukchiensis]MDG4945330.1 bifunctional nicotinamidase/pyrazinamidase [Profundicola chukchiensis]MDG4950403.1 bifunctional nicotinamidase/pyrazinamidase [Profundicola chukchiensis]
MKKTALLVIDVQNDFLPGGSLAVADGDKVIPIINKLIPQYDLVVATQDWHPANHKSFASQHEGKKLFEEIDLNGMNQRLWPDHCVQGTFGGEFHKDLEMNTVEAVFRKGMDPEIDSYSGFYDNGHLKSTGLAGYLKEKGIEEVHFCGIAADYCVYFSIKDAMSEGFKTVLIEEATKPIDAENFEKQKIELNKLDDFKLI